MPNVTIWSVFQNPVTYTINIVGFIKKFIQNVCNVCRFTRPTSCLADAGTNVIGTCSNIERMIQSSPKNIQPAARVRVSSCL